MEPRADNPSPAWQPLTPRGVAAFAAARCGRLLALQLVVALVAAGTAVWFLGSAWFPLIQEGIRRMPAQGELRHGRLDWRGNAPQTLAEGRFFAWSIDPGHVGQARSPADVQVEFGRQDVRLFSLFGYLSVEYRVDWVVPFNREKLEPWWGAWAPVLLALAAAAVLAGLLIAWAALGMLYCGPVWLLGFFLNRELTWAGSWRLAGAALMPGALFLCGAIAVYRLGGMDLLQLLLAFAAHWVVGWIYLPLAVWRVPKIAETAATPVNPFQPATPATGEGGPPPA